jgi:hypothetical protein
MIEPLEQKLSNMEKAQLVEMVLAALDIMDENEQIDFIAKYIDVQSILSRLGKDDPNLFLSEVEAFCLACLNEEYYSDEDDIEEYFSNNDYSSSYYDDDWDYDEYYSNTDWAETFSKLFRLSVMYMRSNDFLTGYDATSRLLSCLTEAMDDERFLGTEDADEYIDVDWLELFSLYYSVMFKHNPDTKQATERAFHYWVRFGERCTEAFLDNVKDISVAESCILDELKSEDNWATQSLSFHLLEQLYERLGMDFDKVSKAKALLDVNDFFYRILVEGLCEQGNWHAAAEAAIDALKRIPMLPSAMSERYLMAVQQKVRASIQSMLADAYENLADNVHAFETLSQMFQETPDYNLYIRTRSLAEKTVGVEVFLEKIEAQLSEKPHGSPYYSRSSLLLSIYSYEGKTKQLLKIAQSNTIGTNYYERKYVALSLIFRAVHGIDGVGENLLEYLTSSIGKEGIADMLKCPTDNQQQSSLLLSGVGLLKGMIAFHIGAATRLRYAKAAYYMCVIRDIFSYLKREDECRDYFNDIILQNSRRPALRDEMSIVY